MIFLSRFAALHREAMGTGDILNVFEITRYPYRMNDKSPCN